MTQQDRQEPTPAQRRRAAQRMRRWLGAGAMDSLLGVRGADEAADRLLANHPVVTAESVQDGLDLLADRRRTHPEGLLVERWGRHLSRVFAVALGLGGVALALVLTAVIWADSEEVSLEEFAADRLGVGAGVLVVPLVVLLALCVVLMWVSVTWRHVISLGEARQTVRWAADRPGQLDRGLPVVEPFSGFASWCTGPAVISWVLAGLTLVFTVWLAGEGDFDLLGPLLLAAGLGLLGWLCFRVPGRCATQPRSPPSTCCCSAHGSMRCG